MKSERRFFKELRFRQSRALGSGGRVKANKVHWVDEVRCVLRKKLRVQNAFIAEGRVSLLVGRRVLSTRASVHR